MHAIGLTGGFCTGKTFVLKILEEQGCCTMRADELAKSIIFSESSPVLQEILAALGPGVLDARQGLDKEKFSRVLFEDHEKRQAVNAIVHPLVSEERQRRIRAIAETRLYDFLIYESALLLESGIYKDFEKIIVVYSPEAVQVRRAMERDRLTRAEALKRIRSQFPLREKLKVANYTIASGGTPESTRANTMEVFHLLKKDFHLL
ncbi:MAG: dephospho-CoA kinase [Acidobacteria bacterium]|jgi:dephospho-CoA kinase|nr:dephospho-CoA kinase [Acidobacteriota bacterium]